MTDVLSHLTNVKRSGKNLTARCPAHEDKQNSLSVRHCDGKWLLKCHAGCTVDAITTAMGIRVADLFDDAEGGDGFSYPPKNRATAQQPVGLTLEQYAKAKLLPVDFLKECGLSDISVGSQAVVRIPYVGANGELLAVRFRVALEGDRFRWKSGNKPCMYGLNRIGDARVAGHVVLVEGESDAHTLWHHRIPAIAIPGAANWREDRDAKCLDGIKIIYVVIEPDKGGQTVRKWLAQSAIRTRTKLLRLPTKDPSALYLANPDDFDGRGKQCCLKRNRGLTWRRKSTRRAAQRLWNCVPILPVPKTFWRSLTRCSERWV